MKKVLSLVLAVAVIATLCIALVACGETSTASVNEIVIPEYTGTVPADFKFGLITLHDDASTYDKNFIDAAKTAAQMIGLSDSQLIIRSGVEEGAECTTVANELVEQGCKVIMADSFGHESYLMEAAKLHKDVQFCHATGVSAAASGLDNFHNAFASIYEGRYLAGIAAGMKMNEMIKAGKFTADQAKMGYVGAYTYAEVISGLTSFYLGAKSVCHSVTMEVQFTGSWYDPTAEKEAAETLITKGAKLISQHADSMGAPSACESKNIPNVSYNGSTIEACPNTFIVSSRIDWAPYMAYIMYMTIEGHGKDIDDDFVGTIETGSVKLTNLNGNVVGRDVAVAIAKARAELINGERHVFDTENFTVNGEKITSFYINQTKDEAGNIVEGSGINVVNDGIFEESTYMSAPYFSFKIDGINFLNQVF